MSAHPRTQGTATRRAFTLIELLVVVVIIGLLAGLLIPAIQSARESGRRLQCANNLHQLGIALNAYHASHDCFPASGSGNGYSIHVRILPDLDMRNLHDSINFNVSSQDQAPNSPNITALRTTVAVLNCPSDAAGSRPYGGTNYAGSRGVENRTRVDNGAIAFWSRQPTAIRDLTDGAGMTAMISEWVVGPSTLGARDRKGSIFATPDDLNGPDRFDRFTAACLAIDVNSAPIGENAKGTNWLSGGYMDTLYNHSLPPNAPSCLSGGWVQDGAYSASSQHGGGVNLLFADGHARFISSTISFKTWRAIGTRNGGEVVALTYD